MQIVRNEILTLLNNSTTEKIKITPIGNVRGIDGREYIIKADEVIKNTKKQQADIMLDKGHFSDEAMGWFALNSIEAKEDGIYAQMEFTSIGKELVDNKVYRYLSPSFAAKVKDGKYEVVYIDSVGLVNKPNLLFKALNNQEDQGESVDTEKLQTENETLKKQIEELKAQIEELLKTQKEEKEKMKLEKVENAIKNGELLPSRKEVALSFEANALNAYLEVAKTEANSILRKSDFKADENKDNKIDEKVAKLLGIKGDN